MRHIIYILIFSTNFYLPLKAQEPHFSNRIDSGLIEAGSLAEASGIAASRRNPGVLWVHNDSDRSPRIFAMTTTGKHLGEYHLQNIRIRDWEDIAVGPGPEDGQSYIYVGEIGDNEAVFTDKFIYRIKEPSVDTLASASTYTVTQVEAIRIQYPDGNRDAETLMVDPLTKDIYIVTKRESNPIVYRIPYPQLLDDLNIAENLGTLNILFPVAGDISANGGEILIKNYHPFHINEHVYYWRRANGQTIREALKAEPIIVPYEPEVQGEAVCWDFEGKDYYTTSEERDIFGRQGPARLSRYERLNATSTRPGRTTPEAIILNQNYPNPFNPQSTISYAVSVPGYVEIELFDVKGRSVGKLVEEYKTVGTHKFRVNSDHLNSGVYYYRLSTQALQNDSIVKKMVVLK